VDCLDCCVLWLEIWPQKKVWWWWSATGEGKGSSYVSVKRARKERLGGANKRSVRARENLTLE
jgi:hypothetical protein